MSESRRKFLTFMTGAIAGVGGVLLSFPFIRSWSPPKYIERQTWDIDFSKLLPGQMTVQVVEGKPIFVAIRTEEQIAALDVQAWPLKDPDSNISEQPESMKNKYRSIKPEVFVGVGLCTHLGCSPAHVKDDDKYLPKDAAGGYFCPCHGAMYDSAGRVFEGGPAPKNLKVPMYEFTDEQKIRISRS